jgi:mannose-6-phosphate isomerase
MSTTSLYPLRFEPHFRYRAWGGRRLARLVGTALPGDGPIGESWLLSDREDHSSCIQNGSMQGRTLGEVLQQWPEQLLGKRTSAGHRFPLLLKLLDVQDALSVQVHPSDAQIDLLPGTENGKTEAWVVLAAGDEARIYAGLKPNTSLHSMREAIAAGRLVELLAEFVPKSGDAVLIPAQTVHSMRDVVVLEVQENSDVTLRLFDWNRIDAKTQQRRPLQVEEALACIDFGQGAIRPVKPLLQDDTGRELLFDDPHFTVWRIGSTTPVAVGAHGAPRVLVCLAGTGVLRFEDIDYPLSPGEAMLLPAQVGRCLCAPHGSVSLLEIALPGETPLPQARSVV